MLSFALCDLLLGMGRSPFTWYVAAFLGNLPLPLGDGCLQTLYRNNVPLAMQGRVFATRNTLVRMVMVGGYFLGAVLADYAVQPVLDHPNPVSGVLRVLVGTGDGRAMGIILLRSAFVGVAASLSIWCDPAVKALEP